MNDGKQVESILKAFIRIAKDATSPIGISLGTTAANILGKKTKIKALTILESEDGFEASLNINLYELKKKWMDKQILKGKSLQELKQKKLPDFCYMPQVVIKMPIGATEERKRSFLQETSNYYKNLCRELKFVAGKTVKQTHRSPQGRKVSLLDDHKLFKAEIKRRVDRCKSLRNAPKIVNIFAEVAKDMYTNPPKLQFLSYKHPLSPARIKNIYYS